VLLWQYNYLYVTSDLHFIIEMLIFYVLFLYQDNFLGILLRLIEFVETFLFSIIDFGFFGFMKCVRFGNVSLFCMLTFVRCHVDVSFPPFAGIFVLLEV
jgi:hypothetical protein